MARRNKRKERTTRAVPAAAPAAVQTPLLQNRYAIIAMLFLLVFVTYLPALRGGLIWDDDGHITKPELRSFAGLYRIWFEVGATQQYYPLLHSAFWLEYKLWGDNTLGYHLVNVFQHAVAACLVYFVLTRLKIPGALLAAAIFAVHPIEVESVAWITEQKNTLSAVFYLAAMRVYLEFDEDRRRSYYFIALVLFILGLLTKTVTATLPAALLVIFWWQRGSIAWKRDVLPLLPFFAFGAVAGVVTAWVERTLIGATGAEFTLSWVERGLLAGRVVWFYLGKLLWPSNLIFIYPRWQPDAAVWWQWLFPIAVLATTVILWAIRKRLRAPLAAWLYFVGTLFPVLGFLNVYPFIYSFVADHFQYLAGLGVIVIVAAGLATAVNRRPAGGRWMGQAACAAVVVALMICANHQSAMYGNVVELYRTTIQRNPECWMAYNNLGSYLAANGRVDESEPLFREAIRLKPDYAEALMNLGVRVARTGRFDEAAELYQRALAAQPDFYEVEVNWGNLLIDTKRPHEAIEHYKAAARLDPTATVPQYNLANALYNMGDAAGAIEYYERSIQLKPEFVEAHFNLGIALAQLGRLDEAADRFRTAIELRPKYAAAHHNLGVALAKSKRDPEAVEEFRKALEIDPKYVAARADLAKAYARLQRPKEAIAAAREALATARSAGQIGLAGQIEAWLASYQLQQIGRDSTSSP